MVIAAQFPQLTFAVGLMGNIGTFLVFLSPMPTFYEVYKKKTTEGIQSFPYGVGLLYSMLWMYYSLIKGDAMILIAIRSICVIIQTFYIVVFVFYAPKRPRARMHMESLKLITMFIVFGFGLFVLLTQLLTKGTQHDVIVGWVFLVLISLCGFVAPLSILTQVIKTKGVKYMPVLLVLSVTLITVVWFLYGLLLGDLFIMIIYYIVYRKEKPDINDNIIENNEQISEIAEPMGAPKVKDQNASSDSQNVVNPVVAIDQTIDIPV